MAKKRESQPMPHTEAHHLLNPLRRLVQSPKKVLRHLDLRPDSSVLELGPGPGYFSLEAARSVPEGRLVLVDVQQEMLDMARKRLEARGFMSVEYHRGDAASLPVENESFDVVFLVAVLGEVPDRDACLKDIHRVLRPDGLLSLTEVKLGDPDFIPMSEMKRLVPVAGFGQYAQFNSWFHYTVTFKKMP